jgi:hypothetical protein
MGCADLRQLRVVMLYRQLIPRVVGGRKDEPEFAAHVVVLRIIGPIRRRQRPVALDHDGREESAEVGAAPLLELEDIPNLRPLPKLRALLTLNMLIQQVLHVARDHLLTGGRRLRAGVQEQSPEDGRSVVAVAVPAAELDVDELVVAAVVHAVQGRLARVLGPARHQEAARAESAVRFGQQWLQLRDRKPLGNRARAAAVRPRLIALHSWSAFALPIIASATLRRPPCAAQSAAPYSPPMLPGAPQTTPISIANLNAKCRRCHMSKSAMERLED